MQNLKVTLVQADPFWEDSDANLELFDRTLDRLGEPTHLVVLPEMFTSGFTMNAGAVAQSMDGPAIAWMKKKSHAMNADITGSLVIGESGRYHNRLVWVKPTGELFAYDKKHLFRYAGEEKIFTPGEKPITVELHGWRIRPFICYDLRFPIWTRNVNLTYHVALFTANWPARRATHWKALLAARAIENQAYVIGVNRVGIDGNGLHYTGDSRIIDPLGTVVFQHSESPVTYTAELSIQELESYWASFPAWMDADSDQLNGASPIA
ncbi:amidohydrolase [uncultured Desulfobacter sp.]|uniref:amidohydrolase n=1 Tax=uncultured Desulfobacter sp. TaxID=240139 RepID=UPI002AAA6A45|nr:amidohydrolase [uncultured Desulfobacter sp.]